MPTETATQMKQQPLVLESIIIRGGERWRVGAVMSLQGERYYQLVNADDSNDVALLPSDDVEPWAIMTSADFADMYPLEVDTN